MKSINNYFFFNGNCREAIGYYKNALSDGGTVTMPIEENFWGARFGALIDKFGIHWMLNYDYPDTQK